MILIGLSGKKGSGKSTLSTFLCNQMEYSVLYSFVDPLKDFLMRVFSLTYLQCYGTEEDKNTLTHIPWLRVPIEFQKGLNGRHPSTLMTARECMQVFGSIVRQLDEDAWVNALAKTIKQETPDLAVISDVRYPNEIRAIEAMGGKVIRLTRVIDKDDSHSSETALDYYPFTYVLDNKSMTLEDTKNKLVEMVW